MKKVFLLFIFIPFVVQSQIDKSQFVVGSRDSVVSKVLNETRPYWVYLPASYSQTMDVPLHYPVVYLLDGTDHFHSVSGLMQFLGSYSQIIPEMIVIAIPNTDRTRDLTPSHTLTMNGKEYEWLATSGGGSNFLKFIQSELIPSIESTYRTTPYRLLIGHSFGGIAAINALYTMPETFNAYISIDPSLWWDDRILLKKAQDHFLNNDLKGRSLFISQANTLSAKDSVNDHFECIKEFAAYLESRNRSGLLWEYKYYSDDHHGSVPLISEYDGLRFIFKNYPSRFDASLGPDVLKKKFADFSQQSKVKFLPPERLVNNCGYQTMAAKQYDFALQYFQMNIDMYPQSSNVYDSMGELWMNKGDNKKAIEYYEKSLKLDPKNENAKVNIKKMKEKAQAKK